MEPNVYRKLRNAGLSDERIQSYLRSRLSAEGLSETRINQYIQNTSGARALSLGGMEQNETIKEMGAAVAEVQKKAFNEGKDLDIIDAIRLGWQESASGMLKRGRLPDD